MGARAWTRAASRVALFVGAAAAACVPPAQVEEPVRLPPPAPAAPVARLDQAPRTPEGPAVVVVVLDGARWQEVFVGSDPLLSGAKAQPADELMPRMHALLAERGAAIGAPGHGPPIQASGPHFVSMPGYSEIFSGRAAHGCADNDCDATRAPTMMDQERAASARLEDVAVIASWEKIEKAATFDPERMVVTTGRSRVHNAASLLDDAGTRDWLERGAQADPFPGFDDYRPDRFTAGLALRYLEAKHPRLMFVGLGEPDEYCHRGAYAGYLASLRVADDFVGDLFAALGRMGERGRNTTVLVTADHGRGKDYRHHGRNFPESSRVWLVALGGAVEARGFATSAMPHHLADVAPTVRAILDLPADDARSAGAPLRELFAPPAVSTALR